MAKHLLDISYFIAATYFIYILINYIRLKYIKHDSSFINIHFIDYLIGKITKLLKGE